MQSVDGMEPQAYLPNEFTELPQAASIEAIVALLPISNDGGIFARVS
jgi:hypothetical protein